MVVIVFTAFMLIADTVALIHQHHTAANKPQHQKKQKAEAPQTETFRCGEARGGMVSRCPFLWGGATRAVWGHAVRALACPHALAPPERGPPLRPRRESLADRP